MQVLDRKSLNKLFDVLQTRGFDVIGPVVRDGPSFTIVSNLLLNYPLAGPTGRVYRLEQWN